MPKILHRFPTKMSGWWCLILYMWGLNNIYWRAYTKFQAICSQFYLFWWLLKSTMCSHTLAFDVVLLRKWIDEGFEDAYFGVEEMEKAMDKVQVWKYLHDVPVVPSYCFQNYKFNGLFGFFLLFLFNFRWLVILVLKILM